MIRARRDTPSTRHRARRSIRVVLLAGALATSTIAAPLVSQPPSTPSTPTPSTPTPVGEAQVGETSPPSGATPEVRDRYAVVPGTASESPTTAPRPADHARRERVVARVDGVAITVGELEDLLTVGATEDDVRAALDASIRRVRLTKEAERRGLAAHPEVRAAERRALVAVLLARDFGSHDRLGGADAAAVDALVTSLRAEHVRDVELEPLYPLALDPRPRSMRSDGGAPTTPSARVGAAGPARGEEEPFAEGVVTQEAFRLDGPVAPEEP